MSGTEGTGRVMGPGVEVPGRSEHRYTVVEQMGQSGGSTTWRAMRGDGREVCVRTMARIADGRAEMLLERELHTLRELSARTNALPELHDWNLDFALDAGDAGATRYGAVVTEYFPEGSLETYIERRGPLRADQVSALLADLFEALVSLHGRPIVHQNIHPGNVRLRGERFVLENFALSRPVGARDDVLPLNGGRPGYRAPEQARGEADKIGIRTDLYSAGATAWSAAVGRLLGTDDETGTWGSFYGLSPLHGRSPSTPEPLANLIMDLLRSAPERRPGSAAEVWHRLQHPPGVYSMLGSRVIQSRRGVEEELGRLTDPSLRHILNNLPELRLAKFQEGDVLCRTGESSYHAFLLLRGGISVQRKGVELAQLSLEGEIVGEAATLTGSERTARVTATDETVMAVFNGAELLDFLTHNPEVAIKMVNVLAGRLVDETRRELG